MVADVVAIVAIVVAVADLAGKFAQFPKYLSDKIASGRQRAVRSALVRVTHVGP